MIFLELDSKLSVNHGVRDMDRDSDFSKWANFSSKFLLFPVDFEIVEKDHQNFYRRWEGLPDFDHTDCANDPNCLLK